MHDGLPPGLRGPEAVRSLSPPRKAAAATSLYPARRARWPRLGRHSRRGSPVQRLQVRELPTNLSTHREHPTQPPPPAARVPVARLLEDRKSTRLNSSHVRISYAVF